MPEQKTAAHAPADVIAPPMPGETATAVAIREQTPKGVIGRAEIMDDEEVRRLWRVAAGLAESGLYKDATQAGQAFAKLLVGREYGLSVPQSMKLHIVEGNVEVPGVMIGSWINARQREGYKYVVRVITNEACEIDFYGPDEYTGERELRGTSTFTKADAEQAELTSNRGTKTSNHVKYPRNMFWNRAMSNGSKWFVPEVLKGMAVYTEGEIERDAVEALGDGDAGDSAAEAIEFPPEVEALLEEAEACGCKTVANRPYVRMRLGYQGPGIVAAWRDWARQQIDAHKLAAEQVTDAVVVDEKAEKAPSESERTADMRAAADVAEAALDGMVDEVVEAVSVPIAEGEDPAKVAESLRLDAEVLRDEANSAENMDEAERAEKLAQADDMDAKADRLDGTQGSLL